VIIADTSGLLALFSTSEPRHRDVADSVAAEAGPLVVSPYVVAELDYLLATRFGVESELAVLDELASGAYALASFDADDLRRAAQVVERYRDQDIGVADASVVVLADRHRTKRILTLDHHHFGVVRPLSGGRFTLLP
jgi:uncharacterized protein